MLRDNVHARWLSADGTYSRRRPLPGDEPFRVQQYLQEEARRHASVSRGKEALTFEPERGAARERAGIVSDINRSLVESVKGAWRRIQEPFVPLQPYMSEREIQLIVSLLDPSHVMLEWGCGGSTLRFSSEVRAYYSIEHDGAWCTKVHRHLKRARRDNVQLVHVPPNLPLSGVPNYERSSDDRYAQFKDYIDQVNRFGVERFDRVLIDGRSRPECAIQVLPYLRSESRVFIHDFFTTKYDPAVYRALLDFHYDLVDAVEEGQSLAVLQPKVPQHQPVL